MGEQATYKRIVVKVGTSTLTDVQGRVDLSYMSSLMTQISQLMAQGSQVALVSSGAITAGLEKLNMAMERPEDMPTLQAAAAIGSVELASRYAYCASAVGLQVAQVLITRQDTSGRTSYLHARNTLNRLLELGVVPIVNENDTVAIDEIKFGDNDTLAAMVATMIDADLVVLLSDIQGLYTADPRKSDDAQLIEHVGSFSEELVASAGGAGTKTGSGGMATKVEAARVLMRAGIPMVICEGHAEQALERAICGESLGTRFDSGQATVQAKKLWIALGDATHGTVFVDEGAAKALRERGGSLLPVGVKAIEGEFEAGDALEIRSGNGQLIGRGIAQVNSYYARKMMGKHSEELDAVSTYTGHHEIIHRDEMIVY